MKASYENIPYGESFEFLRREADP